MFQFVNLPALQTSNRVKGNQKALHSSCGKRRTVKAALYMRLGAGAWMRDEWLAFAHLILIRDGTDGGAWNPGAPCASCTGLEEVKHIGEVTARLGIQD